MRNSPRIHSLLEEKQRILAQKQEAEANERRKLEEEQKLQAAQKYRTRTRRRLDP